MAVNLRKISPIAIRSLILQKDEQKSLYRMWVVETLSS